MTKGGGKPVIRVMNYGFPHCTVPSLGVSAIASSLSQHIYISESNVSLFHCDIVVIYCLSSSEVYFLVNTVYVGLVWELKNLFFFCCDSSSGLQHSTHTQFCPTKTNIIFRKNCTYYLYRAVLSYQLSPSYRRKYKFHELGTWEGGIGRPERC